VAPPDWLGERLAMGHYANVSRGAGRLGVRALRKVEEARRKLHRLSEQRE